MTKLMPVLACLAMAGCATGTATDPATEAAAVEPVAEPRARPQRTLPANDEGITAMTFGKGRFDAGGYAARFQFNVTVYDGDRAEGTFFYVSDDGALDLAGEIDCVALDHDAAHGWLAGTLTRNASTDPRYAADAGAGVWFRIVDRNLQRQQPLITPPELAATKRAAQRACASAWRNDGLVLVDEGALAIFP